MTVNSLDTKQYLPPADESVPNWESNLAWGLKAIIILTALAQFARGQFMFGLGALVVAGIALIPAISAKSRQVNFPVEIEIPLFLILVVHLTLGLLLDFYNRFDHYDKFIHYGNSVLIAYIGFLVVYAMYFTGRLKASPLMMGFVILAITLGVGAFWEIIEYSSDQLLYEKLASVQKQQGSPTMGGLDDTMWDLILDFGGGIVGAIFGALYVRWSKKTGRRRFVEVMVALSGEPVEKHHSLKKKLLVVRSLKRFSELKRYKAGSQKEGP
jgi:hypothetical protein